MVKKKDSFWEHAEEIENSRFICKFCHGRFSGGISRIKSHLSGLSGRDIQVCLEVPEAIQLKAKEALQPIGPPSKRTKNVAASNNFLEGEIVSSSSSSHMPNRCKLDKQYATLLMSDRVCCDALSSPLFKDFLNGVAEHGPGYELPSSFTLKSRVIPDIKKEVVEYVKNVIKNSVKTGYTLMCRTRSCYSNFEEETVDIFAYTPIGMVCLNQYSLYSDFSENMSYVMMLFRPANAVQFIIDSFDDYFLPFIKNILTEEYPQIYQTRCPFHEIRALLVKISDDVPFVHNTLSVASFIVSYIVKHKVDVPLRRVQEMRSDHVASRFFTLISLLEVESELQAFQVSIVTLSSDWEKLLNDMEAVRVAKFIDLAIHCKEFWNRGKIVAKVLKLLFQVLYLVHREGPTFVYLYEMMERVQDTVKQCRESNQVLYDDIWRILNKYRSDIIRPIHAAAAFLNPIYMYSENFVENVEMGEGVDMITQNLVGLEEMDAFMSQLQLYRSKDPNLFTDQAMTMLKTSHPRVWWESCGNHLPVLQKYAIQILGQPCSTILCKRLELRGHNMDFAFMLNAMMMERYKYLETQMREPIILDKLDVVLDDDRKFEDLWDGGCADSDAVKGMDFVFSRSEDLPEDPTGSWLDSWPNK